MNEPQGQSPHDRLVRIGLGVTVVVLVLLAAAYLDLRSRVNDLRVEVAALGAGVPATGTPSAEVSDAGAADAGPERPGFRSYDLSPEDSPEDWQCEGTVATEMIQTVVGTHGPKVYECYRERLLEMPDLAGTVVIYTKVRESGQVERVRVVGTIDDQSLRGCVATSAATWAFPPPVGGECAIVQMPFALRPDTATPREESSSGR